MSWASHFQCYCANSFLLLEKQWHFFRTIAANCLNRHCKDLENYLHSKVSAGLHEFGSMSPVKPGCCCMPCMLEVAWREVISIAITYELQIFNVFLLKYTLQAPVLLQFSLWVIVSMGFCSLPSYNLYKQYGRLANIMVTWKALWRVETFAKVLKLNYFFFFENRFFL